MTREALLGFFLRNDFVLRVGRRLSFLVTRSINNLERHIRGLYLALATTLFFGLLALVDTIVVAKTESQEEFRESVYRDGGAKNLETGGN